MQYRPHRYQTQFPMTIRTPHGMQQGQVRDVSNTGAQISGLKGANRGDKISLDVLSTRVEAVIKWVTPSHVGVSFRPQISDHLLDTLRKRPDGRLGRRSAVGFAFAEMR